MPRLTTALALLAALAASGCGGPDRKAEAPPPAAGDPKPPAPPRPAGPPAVDDKGKPIVME